MNNWFLAEAVSSDICFCHGNCKNIKCMRNDDGDFLKRVIKKTPYILYSLSDFSDSCKSFVKGD